MKKFLVITTARSGSTWMVDSLHEHPDVKMFGEMFLPRKRRWFAGAGDLPEYVELRHQRPRPFSVFRYLDRLYAPSESVQVVGFKLMYAHLRIYPEILWYWSRYRIPSIHLVRENLLDVMISIEKMRITGLSHQIKESEEERAVREDEKIHLDPDATLAFMRKREKQIAVVRRLVKLIPAPSIEV